MKKQPRFVRTAPRILFICLLALVLRLALASYLYSYDLRHGGNGAFTGKDDSYYWYIGKIIAANWRSYGLSLTDFSEIAGLSLTGYYYVNAISNLVFRDNGLPVLLIANAFIGTLVVYVSYLVAKHISNESVGELAAWLVALLPRFVFWSSLNFRDVHLALFFLLTIYGLSNKNLPKPRSAFLVFIGVLGTLWLRPWQGIALLGALAVLIAIGMSIGRFSLLKLPKKTIVSIIVIVYFIGSASVNTAVTRVENYFQYGSEIAWAKSQTVSSEDSLFRPYFSTGPLGRALLAPVSIFISLTYPFPPWLLAGNLTRDVETISNWFWYPLIPMFGFALLTALRSTSHKAFVAAFLTVAILLSQQASGPILLQRTAYTLQAMYMIFAAYGIRYMRRTDRWFVATAYGVFVASLVYAFLKRDLDQSVILGGGISFALAVAVFMYRLGQLSVSRKRT